MCAYDENEMGELSVLCEKGDTKILWNTKDPEQVKKAECEFKKFLKKGCIAFKVKRGGAKGEQIREFDPKAGKIILVPVMAGG